MPQSRIRLILIFVAILLIGAWWVFFNPSPPSQAAATPTFPPPPQVTITPPSLEDLAQQFPRLARLLRDPNVDSAYKDFVVAYEQGGLEAAEALARTRGLLTPDDHVRVTLVVDTLDTASLREDLQALGVNILGAYNDLIDISIPLEVIIQTAQSDDPVAVFENIRDLEHVVSLQFSPPSTPQSLGAVFDRLRPGRTERPQVSATDGAGAPPPDRPAAGEYVSEGLSAINADQWHAAGFTGRGLTIGILDQGFDGYRDRPGGELPESIVVQSFVAGVEPDATGESHGTAVAEIVHDVAPDAELFLAYYDGGDVSMGNAVEWLMAQGAQIISHSAGGLAGPMDGTGRDAELVDRVAAEGVLWINSAGNSANEHYRSIFNDTDGDAFHDFSPRGSLLAFRPVPDKTTQIVLNWDEWPTTSEDYDLYLIDPDGVVLASSRNVQSGQRAPVEQILYRFEDPGTYYVSIQAVRTTGAARLDLYIHEARSMERTTPAHSLATPGDARGALTVGAAFVQTGALEPFSSYGPTEDGRPKPELVGPDGVSASIFAPDLFYGTSAAAPHVAGAAALVWSAHPEFDAASVRDFLIESTVPLAGSPNPDAIGAGWLRLPAPAQVAGGSAPTQPALPVARPPAVSGSPAGAAAAICLIGIAGVALVSAFAIRRRRLARHSAHWPTSASATCDECGAQARAGAQFCSQCGRAMDAAASRRCAQCGHRLRPGAAFCSACGTTA